MSAARLVSIQVGVPQTRGVQDADNPLDEEWTSAIFKTPVQGPVWLGTTNLDGDRQADLKNHGGPHRAALAYGASHYPLWQQELGLAEPIPYGRFGENFTIDGLTEQTVCLGDVYALGEAATVQVSQPRTPCWKLDRRWLMPGLQNIVSRTGRHGWYFRVLQEGMVEVGQTVRLVERLYPDWKIGAVAVMLRESRRHLDAKARLSGCAELSPGWREAFADQVARFG